MPGKWVRVGKWAPETFLEVRLEAFLYSTNLSEISRMCILVKADHPLHPNANLPRLDGLYVFLARSDLLNRQTSKIGAFQ